MTLLEKYRIDSKVNQKKAQFELGKAVRKLFEDGLSDAEVGEKVGLTENLIKVIRESGNT